MNLEQEDHPSAKEFATEKYSEVDKPFQLYPGLSRDAFDYILSCIFSSFPFCALRLRHLHLPMSIKLEATALCAAQKNGREICCYQNTCCWPCIFVVVFILGMVIHLSIINLAFGTECLKTSFQMLFSHHKSSQYQFGGNSQVILVLAGLYLYWQVLVVHYFYLQSAGTR